jgi:hypothetical protein
VFPSSCPFQDHDITFRHPTKGQTFARFSRDKRAKVRVNLEQVDVAFLASSGIDRISPRAIGATGIGPFVFRVASRHPWLLST